MKALRHFLFFPVLIKNLTTNMLTVSLVFLTLLWFSGCTPRNTPPEENGNVSQVAPNARKSAPKTFVFCLEGGPSRFGPSVEADGSTYNVTNNIYKQLTAFEYGTTRVIPSLAEGWQVSEDGLIYTFDLRKGVKFHSTSYFTPTRDFNADDVVFSFQRQKDPKHPYHEVGGGVYEYFDSMDMGNIIKSVEKVNDHRIKFTLSRPNAPFTANLAMPFTGIYSKEYADKLLEAKTPEKIDNEPIGTGPFKYVSYQKDALVRLQAFEGYWGERGNIQNLIYAITPDASVRLQKVRQNECQAMAYPDFADLEAVKQDKNLNLLGFSGPNLAYLSMNVQKKPFDNKLVRQAMRYALNKKAYIEGVYMGNAQVAKNPIAPTIWSYNESVQDYDYNPDKAKELLKQAGLSNGFEVDFWTLPVSRPYLPNGRKLGEMVQTDLAKVNIRVKLVSYDWSSYLDKARKREHTLLQMGWQGDNGDPDNFLYLLSCEGAKSGANNAGWCHKPFDDLFVKAQQLNNLKERTDLYKKAQEIFREETPWVPIAHATTFRILQKGVSGYKVPAIGAEVFDFISLED